MEFSKKYLRSLDWTMIFLIVCLGGFSFIGISGSGVDKQWTQLVFYVLGFLVMIGVLLFDYNTIRNFAYPLYGFGIVLLIGVLFMPEHNNARSWYDFGPILFQPSELMKLFVIMAIAKFLADKSEKEERFNTFRDLSPVLILFGIPLFLIFIQPDLGTSLVFTGILGSMLLVAGIPRRFYLMLGGGVAAIFGILTLIYFFANKLFFMIIKDYQWARIMAWFYPNDYARQGYQLRQALTAIGSGQLFGKGIGHGTQARFGWVPVGESDFIFTVISEEMGFIGASILILILFVMIYRMVRIAMESKDMYGMYLVTGVIGMFVFQIFENIGMTIQLMPITGIPLPFISYGGSSLLSNFLIMGMVLNVGMRRKKLTFE